MPYLASKASFTLATHPLKSARRIKLQVIHSTHALLKSVEVIETDVWCGEFAYYCREKPVEGLQDVRSRCGQLQVLVSIEEGLQGYTGLFMVSGQKHDLKLEHGCYSVIHSCSESILSSAEVQPCMVTEESRHCFACML